MRIIIALFIALLIPSIMHDKSENGTHSAGTQDQLPLFSFGLISDIQYCDCEPVGTRYYRSSLIKLEEAMRSFRIDSPAFVVNLGDMIEKDFSSYQAVYRILDSSGIKIYNLTGNHDYSVEPRLKKRIPPLKLNKDGYYSFTHMNFRFIFLNGNELSTYASGRKSVITEANNYISTLKDAGEMNAIEWNGGMSSKQILWLSYQLNSAKRENEKVFIMCHFPVYPDDKHNLLNCKDLLTVIRDYDNIIAWFSGHNHAGNYGNLNLVHFVTFKGMVETEKTNSFALIEVYKNKIWIKGNGREKSQILAY
jgi:manganese-dependent ADP-ribose/CDP-alcohol diphosphatase